MPPNSLNTNLRWTERDKTKLSPVRGGVEGSNKEHKPAAVGTAFLPWPPGSGLGRP